MFNVFCVQFKGDIQPNLKRQTLNFKHIKNGSSSKIEKLSNIATQNAVNS